MPSYIRMKTVYVRGLQWLYLLGLGYMVLSLEPGYLDFDNLPDTNFSCVGKVIGGYYADLETNCQMFHVCTIGQLDEPMDIRFLCLNGTVFDQETRVCERIDEVDCSKSEQFYSLNLELYGNTQPSLVEDNPETDPPIIIKSTTTTTTTTTQRPKPKTTRAQFYTTATPTITTATKVISAHHFPISSQPDIRFNPEEINISLNPRTAPNIRTKPVSFQQQIFSNSDDVNHNNNKKAIVTTHTTYGNGEKEDFVRVVPHTQRPQVATTQKVKSVVNYGLTHDKTQPPATPADINYGFTYQTEKTNQEYRTELPQHNYQYHTNNYKNGNYRTQFKTTTYRTEHVTTRKHSYIPHREPTTYRNPYVISSIKPTDYHNTYRTEKPQRLQLPLPLLPTLPPLTFSSPAPFTLTRHIETKRYTNDHQPPPPRIIISASASVSDASGRRLNYSLGTIGVTPLLEEPPKSYDEYKDHDVVLDPFYHDVPKIKKTNRSKRQIKHSDIIRNEQEAVDVLKFLFDWYRDQENTTSVTVPIPPEVITEINEQLAPIAEAPKTAESLNITVERQPQTKRIATDFRESGLFQRKSKFNIVGDVLSVTETLKETTTSTTTPAPETIGTIDKYGTGTEDYVDDNYEALVHEENVKKGEETKIKEVNTSFKEESAEEKEKIQETEKSSKDEVHATSKDENSENKGSKTYIPANQIEEKEEEEEEETHEAENTEDEVNTTVKEEDSKDNDNEENITANQTEEIEIQEPENVEEDEVHVSSEEEINKDKESKTDISTSQTEEKLEIHEDENTGDQEHTLNKKTNVDNEDESVETYVSENNTAERGETNEEEEIIEDEVQAPEESSENTEDQTILPSQTEENEEVNEFKTETPENIENDVNTSSKEETVEDRGGETQISTSQIDEKQEMKEHNTENQQNSEEVEVYTDNILETKLDMDNTESNIEQQTDHEENIDITTEPIESYTLNEDINSQNYETTTTTTTTTTPKPNIRRRGRGRFQHQKIINEENGNETHKKYSSSFVNDPSQVPSRPKSRRRGRVRSTTESYKTESVSEETIPSSTISIKEKKVENVETTENIVTTVSDLPETTTLKRLDDKQEVESIAPTEALPTEPTTVKEISQISDYDEQNESYRRRQRVRGRSRGRGRGRSRMNNNQKHETESTESRKNTEPSNVTEESIQATSELPKKEISEETTIATVSRNKPEKKEETVLSEPHIIDREDHIEMTSTLPISSTTPEHVSNALESTKYEKEEQTTMSLRRQKSRFKEVLSTSKTLQDEPTVIEANKSENLDKDVVPTSNTFNGEETIGPPEERKYSTSTESNKFEDQSTSSRSSTQSIAEEKYPSTLSNIVPTSKTSNKIKNEEKIEKTELPIESSTANMYKESTLSLAYLASLAFSIPVTTETSLVKEIEINSTSTEPTNLTPAELTTTETVISSPRARGHSRRTRPHSKNSSSHKRPNSRHRFSTELLTSRPNRRKYVEEEIIDVLSSQLTTAKSIDNGEEVYSTSTKISTTLTTDNAEDVPATDAPLFKSANPTQAESAKVSLHTTPLSMVYNNNRVHVRMEKIRRVYIFNCFGKAINKFYSDPRDCRLFHYCTSGYTRNQLLDMKFVCDLGTYFDDEKLICTKVKPERCL